jgi:predicted ribosome quality control (RQC) complex YloA/Tae2 family protein
MNEDLIEKIADELNEALAGGLVSRIDQPGPRCIVLRVFSHGQTKRLLVSASAPNERIHLTDKKTPNPARPPRFCALLRSRIKNARIINIRKLPGERIVEIDLQKKTVHGEAERLRAFTLRVELTGRSSNIILLDDKGLVVDALRYFRPGVSPRAVMPGLPLAALGPRKDEPRKGVAAKAQGPRALQKEKDESWNDFAARYYESLTGDEAVTAYRRDLRRALTRAIKKTRRKIDNLEADRRKAEASKDLGRFGELILPNMGRIKRGAREARVMDYTAVPPVEVSIPLDERLGPRENAEKYFRKAKKARRALEMLAGRIPATRAELEELLSLDSRLERAATIEDLFTLEEALVKAGYMRPEQGRAGDGAPASDGGRTPRKPGSPIRKFRSSEGLTVLLGRNARGNDEIVRKEASKGDVWLHAKDAAGSHVLIKTGGRDISRHGATLREAAALAAWHSKARAQDKAEVIYTDIKHVTKPPGARPGMVQVREFKTMLVRPEERLKEKKR